MAHSLRAEVVNEVTRNSQFNGRVDTVTGFGTRNMICMPVLGGDMKLLGVIQVQNRKGADFSTCDESILSALAVQVGLTLESGRFFCSVRPSGERACVGQSSQGEGKERL